MRAFAIQISQESRPDVFLCTLLTIHNLHFYLDLTRQAREHIEAGDYASWHKAWIERYETGAAERKAKRLGWEAEAGEWSCPA